MKARRGGARVARILPNVVALRARSPNPLSTITGVLVGSRGTLTTVEAARPGARAAHREMSGLQSDDLPGLGDSASAPGELTPSNLAAPIVAGLDTLFGRDAAFDLAGFSFGGLIGSQVAKAVGERMRTYVAVGASGFEPLHVRVLGIEVPEKDMTDREKNEIHRNNLRLLMIHDEAKIDDLAVYTHRRNVARSRVRSRSMSLGNHLVDVVPDIKARLAGIWGVHDATGGGREQILKRRDIFAAHQPDVPFAIIEDVGHWVMYEAPDEFNAALLGTLDR